MTTASLNAAPAHRGSWLSRSEQWLDDRGKGAWIAAMVLGLSLVQPRLADVAPKVENGIHG